MLHYESAPHCFFWWNNIQLYGFIYISIHQCMDIWVVSTFWLLWLIPLCAVVYKPLCEYMFSILLGMYLRVEVLGHSLMLCLTFEELPNCFSHWLYHFTFLLTMDESYRFSIFLSILIFLFLDYNEPSMCTVGSPCAFDLCIPKSKRVPEKHLLYWLCQSLWLCGSQ